jgi:hypothetical protein
MILGNQKILMNGLRESACILRGCVMQRVGETHLMWAGPDCGDGQLLNLPFKMYLER